MHVHIKKDMILPVCIRDPAFMRDPAASTQSFMVCGYQTSTSKLTALTDN